MAIYKYQKLRGRNRTRILHLLPGNGDDILQGSLSDILLETLDKYEAISYVWGSDSKTHFVQTAEGTIGITNSLHSALKSLRLPSTPRYLWADALCINQDDNEEKSIQVRMMGQIYGQALRVLIYLGDEADGSDLAFDLLQEMSSEELRDLGEIGKLSRSSLGKKNLAPVAAIMCRPWWRRVWIIQEFINAKDVFILAGSKEMHWKPSFQAIDNTYSYGELSLNKYQRHFQNIHQGTTALSTLDIGRDKMTNSLLDLFDLFQDKEATTRRDHLFALLSLADDAGDEDLDPDYEEPLDSVARRYAAVFVKRGQVFHLLGTASGSNLQLSSKRFPSWIPDWTTKRQFRSPNGVGSPEAIYNAAGSTTAEAHYDRASDQLVLKGLQFDRIDNVIYTCNSKGDKTEGTALWNNERQRSYLERCGQMIHSGDSYPTEENLREVLWRTLIANRDFWGNALDESSSDYMKSSYFEFRNQLGLSISTSHDETLDLGKGKALMERDECSSTFLSLSQHLTLSRTKRSYMCLVPHICKNGDWIFILQGCPVPFVLRQMGIASESLYQLIGKTYVHGIMDGEAIRNDKHTMAKIYLK